MRWLLPLLVCASLFAQDPTAARNWLNQGVQAFRAAQYGIAVQDFQQAVAADPSSTVAHLYLGTAYMQQYIPGADSVENNQRALLAQEAFLQTLALDRSNTMALSSLASLFLNQKKWDDARAWFQKMIALDPNNADAYYSLGFIAWSQWYPEYRKARASVGLKPDDPGPIPALTVRRDLQSRFGPLLEGGIADLQKALELNPQYEDAMAYMNLLIRERADLRDTREQWQRDVAVANQWIEKTLETKKLRAQQLPPVQPGIPPTRIRIGGAVQAAKLVHRVEPLYPPQQARIQGAVRLNLIISREGAVTNVTVISGHPLLVPAAVEALKQWTYTPTLLNGAPVEVSTEIEVPFTLAQ